MFRTVLFMVLKSNFLETIFNTNQFKDVCDLFSVSHVDIQFCYHQHNYSPRISKINKFSSISSLKAQIPTNKTQPNKRKKIIANIASVCIETSVLCGKMRYSESLRTCIIFASNTGWLNIEDQNPLIRYWYHMQKNWQR